MNKPFLDLLERMKVIHEKKVEDYASKDNPHQNFERSAYLMSWFKGDVDKAYVNLIGTKLARLATLLGSNKKPNNESIDDTFLDLATYCALWYSNYIDRNVDKDNYFK